MGAGITPRVRALAATGAAVAIAVTVAVAPGARASSAPTPWDGTNPFNCTIQNAGLGPTGPDPGADPYCVSFDKTDQNLTQAGIVDFLLKEPARTAAAEPKCFYFQEDHWRGSIQQSDGTAVYEFEGHYFFNKATGDGGAWITGFTVEGQTFDPTSLPGFPPGYGQDFGPGTGGFITHDDVPVDPQCVAQAASHPVYPPSATPRCVPDAGNITKTGIGPLSLDSTEQQVRTELGAPEQVKHGFLSYCVTGGGALFVGQRGDRSGTLGPGGDAPTLMLLTTARGFVLTAKSHRTVAVGASQRQLRRVFPHTRAMKHAYATRLAPGIIAGIRHRKVTFLAVYSRKAIHTKRGLRRFLARYRA